MKIEKIINNNIVVSENEDSMERFKNLVKNLPL